MTIRLKYAVSGSVKLFVGDPLDLVDTGWEVVEDLTLEGHFIKGAAVNESGSLTTKFSGNTSVQGISLSGGAHTHDDANDSGWIGDVAGGTCTSDLHSHRATNRTTFFEDATAFLEGCSYVTSSGYTKGGGSNNSRALGINRGTGNTNGNYVTTDASGHNHPEGVANYQQFDGGSDHNHAIEVDSWDAETRPNCTKVYLIRWTR